MSFTQITALATVQVLSEKALEDPVRHLSYLSLEDPSVPMVFRLTINQLHFLGQQPWLTVNQLQFLGQ